jgi:hypothetical protein
VIALEARPFLGSSNQIIEAARARLSLRTVPGMEAREAGRLIVKKLTTKPAYGVKVTAKINGTTPWWTTEPRGAGLRGRGRRPQGGLRQGDGEGDALDHPPLRRARLPRR